MPHTPTPTDLRSAAVFLSWETLKEALAAWSLGSVAG